MKSVLEGDVITLDNDEEYICCSRLEDNNKVYLCLVSTFKPVEFRFAEELVEGAEVVLEIIYDQDEKEHVLKLFNDKVLRG